MVIIQPAKSFEININFRNISYNNKQKLSCTVENVDIIFLLTKVMTKSLQNNKNPFKKGCKKKLQNYQKRKREEV